MVASRPYWEILDGEQETQLCFRNPRTLAGAPKPSLLYHATGGPGSRAGSSPASTGGTARAGTQLDAASLLGFQADQERGMPWLQTTFSKLSRLFPIFLSAWERTGQI